MQTQTGNTYRNIAANIGALAAHTTYHFRIVETDGAGSKDGWRPDLDYALTALKAEVSVCYIAGIELTIATLYGVRVSMRLRHEAR